MIIAPRLLPSACLALLAISACHTNQAGLVTSPTQDAGTDTDAGLDDGIVRPPPGRPDGDLPGADATPTDGLPPATLLDATVPPPRPDAIPDTPITPPADTRPIDAPRAPDTLVTPPGPDASPDIPLPPMDSRPSDLAPPPVDTRQPDTRQPDTRQPDTRQPDTRRPDTRTTPTPVYDWPINSTTTLGGNDLTTNGAPTVTRIDPLGNVVCFDGVDDGLLLDQNPIARMEAFTIQLLMRPAFDGSSDPRVLQIEAANNNQRRLTMELRAGQDGTYHAYSLFSWDQVSAILENADATHAPNEWIWMAVSYDGQTMRLYMNGALEASDSVSGLGPMSVNSSMSLGMRQSLRYFFPGCLARLIVSNSALTAADLQQM